MYTEPSHFQYQFMCTRLCTYFNTFWWEASSNPLIYVLQSNMDRKFQYADPLDAAEYLSERETNLIQQVCGTLWYYAISIGNTILPFLSDIYS